MTNKKKVKKEEKEIEKLEIPVWMKWVLCLIIPTVAFLCLMDGCSYLNKKARLDDDNFIEEAIEHLIEEKTGLDIDLSPKSPE